MIQHIRAAVLIGLIASQCTQATTVIKGDSDTATQTFTFGIGPTSSTRSMLGMTNVIVVGANQAISGNTYALSLYAPTLADHFIPLGVKYVSLNRASKQLNPLYGQKIKFVRADNTLEDQRGMQQTYFYSVTSQTSPQTERFSLITTVDTTNKTKPELTMYQSVVPYDASGSARAGNIVGLTSAYIIPTGSMVFGAVTENGVALGLGNSGIAAMRLRTVEDKAKKTSKKMLQPWDLNTGKAGNKAFPFNASMTALSLGTAAPTILTNMDSVIDFYWDHSLQRLFAAVQVNAASGTDNGACAVAVGRFNKGKLIFEPLVTKDAVLASNSDIIVGARNGGNAAIYKVRTMHTSTGLTYLIVNGGNGAQPAQASRPIVSGAATNLVYAIPLVQTYQLSKIKEDLQATAADVTQEPLTLFNDTTQTFQYRSFTHQATTAAQLNTNTSPAALVGGGELPFVSTLLPTPQPLADLTVLTDTVYATVPYTYAAGSVAQQPGVYQSHAIFDHYGRIAAWTPWQRVTGTTDGVYHAYPDAMTGNFVFITGATADTVNTVKKTEWGTADKDGLLGGTTANSKVGLVQTMNTMFDIDHGGIQHLSQYDEYNSGLTGKTVMLAASNNRFMFVITGDNRAATDTIQPYTGDFASTAVYNTTGEFPAGTGQIFGMSGGALAHIGPASAATIFSTGTGSEKRSWIAVGGTYGLTILSDAHGDGYASDSLPTGFTFKPAGHYSFVRKLVADGQYLYVLTNDTFDRITIDPASFVSGNLNKTPVANQKILNNNAYTCFYDAVVGQNLAFLATNIGLWRVVNGRSIKNDVPIWQTVLLGEGLLPVYSLDVASSAHTITEGFANGSQLYALSAYQGYDDARIFRLYVHEGDTITNDTVQTISDLYVKNTPSYFASFGQMQAYYTDTGSMRLVSRPQNRNRSMALEGLPGGLRVAAFNFPTTRRVLLPVKGPNCGFVGPAMLACASGAWLSFGDFGLNVNE